MSSSAPAAELAAVRPASSEARRARATVIVLVVALIVLGLAWELWLAPTGRRTLAVKVLPLVPLLVGLAVHRLATYRWLSLLLWAYVGEGLVRGYLPSQARNPATPWLAWAEVALGLALFAACVWYVRLRLRGRGAQ